MLRPKESVWPSSQAQPCSVGQPPQLVDEARLADAGLAGDEQQAALAGAQPVDGLQAGGELGLAADHRRRSGRAGRPDAASVSRASHAGTGLDLPFSESGASGS